MLPALWMKRRQDESSGHSTRRSPPHSEPIAAAVNSTPDDGDGMAPQHKPAIPEQEGVPVGHPKLSQSKGSAL